MSEKIKSIHLERTAYVYVRQSSTHQVRHNLESQRRQYALAQHARDQGFGDVQVIDEDLGRSDSGSQERPGFGKLLVAVCRSHVGAVLALEASRLARNNRDWHHLMDLCAMTDTLVIDYEGIYDPGLANDRLLLGLKGSLSEYELDILRQRAQEALLQKIRRGEVLTQVSIGYIRTEDNGIEKIPDRQIRDAIVGIFSKFCDDAAIVSVLNRLGYRTGAGNTWTEPRVCSLRSYHKINAYRKTESHLWLTLAQAAKELKISTSSIRRLLLNEILPGKQVVQYVPWVIQRQNLALPAVQEAVSAIRQGRKLLQTEPGNAQPLLFQACSEV